jgi:protein-S-isoprenylcysteine O-methyltransferase Ste14
MSGTEGRIDLKALIGSGDRIMLFVLPFAVIGVALNIAFPAAFSVGGPSQAIRLLSVVGLTAGVVIWLWAVEEVLTKVPKGELITNGPFRLVKHPIYTGVSLLVLPSLGLLLDSWLGVVLGAAMYIASRRYAPTEEERLADAFGDAWEAYVRSVRLPWL